MQVAADAEAVDLIGATLLDVELETPRIAALSMRDATVRRLRIGGGRIGTLDVSGLRGTTLSTFQVQLLAPVMADGLGIRVSD